MSEPPSDRCGYTFPENYDPDVASTAYQQSCCYRRTLPDVDRCAWHADPAATSEKSVETLREAQAPPEVRAQNTFDGGVIGSSYAELLDGAVLRGMSIEDELSFSSVTLRGSDLTGADLRRADLERTNLALWPATMEDATLRGAQLRRGGVE